MVAATSSRRTQPSPAPDVWIISAVNGYDVSVFWAWHSACIGGEPFGGPECYASVLKLHHS